MKLVKVMSQKGIWKWKIERIAIAVPAILLTLVAAGCDGKAIETSGEQALPAANSEVSASGLLTQEMRPESEDNEDHDDSTTPTPLAEGQGADRLEVHQVEWPIVEGDALGQENVSDDVNLLPTDDDSAPLPPDSEEESISNNGVVLNEDMPYGALKDIPEDYHYLFDIEVPPEPKDEVVVTSLNIQECVARGFIHNLSDSMFARDVVVTLESLDGVDNATWHWPLSLMPGERAPFEIKIGWVPSRLPIDDPYYWEGVDGKRNRWRDPVGNIVSTVSADFSTEVDVTRAFVTNFDGSVDPSRNFDLTSWAFDERLYTLDEWEITFRHPRGLELISMEAFDKVYPESLVVSADLDTVLSRVSELHWWDFYYVPKYIFPNHYDHQLHTEVNDVRVFYADTRAGKVLDVKELIPFEVAFEGEEETLKRRVITPRSSFINVDSGQAVPRYVVSPTPHIYVEISASDGKQDYYRITTGEIWVGRSESGGPPWDIRSTYGQAAAVPGEGRGWAAGSCDRPGGLTREIHKVLTGVAVDIRDMTFGYFGVFNKLERFPQVTDPIVVDPFTMLADDGFVRGLVHNVSDHLFARDVAVSVSRKGVPGTEGTWSWPLTVQPGERAPFEVFIGGWEGNSPNSEFDVVVSAILSDRVDISRSFQIHRFGWGSVYELQSDARVEEVRQKNADYEDYIRGLYLNDTYLHITFDEFKDTYGAIACLENGERLETNAIHFKQIDKLYCEGEDLPFGYVDFYAHISIPDSHPSLSKQIASQTIHDLQAYVAILDENAVVKDVKEVTLFTSGYSKATGEQEYVVANMIPVPNLLDPGGVRLLFTRPQYEGRVWDDDYSYQVWIGGANKSGQ